MSSPPVTGQLKAQRATRYEAHLQYSAVVDPRPLLFPKLRIFLQPAVGARIRVDEDPAYAGIRTLTNLLAIMTLITCGDVPCKKAFTAKVGEDREVRQADIVDFFVNHTPTIVLKDLRGEGDDDIVWGEVAKGDTVGADVNEIFLLLELAAALRDPPPPNIAQPEIQRNYQRLILTIVLLHQVVHALTKYFFTPYLLTPLINAMMIPDDKGNGDPGLTFERDYLRSHLETAWTHPDSKMADRMWRISYLLAAHSPWASPLILDEENIVRILESFKTNLVWIPPPDEFIPYPFNNNTHVRHRLGLSRPMEDVEDEAHSEQVNLSDMVIVGVCSRGGGY
ncbi:hypothetical protein DFH09DRAFT_1280982 [Mycena vulgaris]|nr:hypothetical protein DFH09DRAFT_1280982 [Mycena vulgaris]